MPRRRAHRAPARRALDVLAEYQHRSPGVLARASNGGVGYLLKDRVADIDAFLDAVHRVAAGGTVLDPKVVSGLLSTLSVLHHSPAYARDARRSD